jgi:predicted transposase/invertase (TIGR01784 family)
LDAVPETMGEIPEIRKAFEVANQANLTREELEDLEKREIWIHDQRNAIKKAVNQAVKQKEVEIAKRLLDVLDEETVSQATGLSLEEVQRLKRDRSKGQE